MKDPARWLLEESMEVVVVQAIVMERWQQRAEVLGMGLDSAGD